MTYDLKWSLNDLKISTITFYSTHSKIQSEFQKYHMVFLSKWSWSSCHYVAYVWKIYTYIVVRETVIWPCLWHWIWMSFLIFFCPSTPGQCSLTPSHSLLWVVRCSQTADFVCFRSSFSILKKTILELRKWLRSPFFLVHPLSHDQSSTFRSHEDTLANSICWWRPWDVVESSEKY